MATQIPFGSIAVLGFGLIGASICKAVREITPSVRLTALDVDEVVRDPAAKELVDTLVSASDTKGVSKALRDSELTVLAVPVSLICEALPFALQHGHLVTDCGSTKRAIVHEANRSKHRDRFVPGHPMAGGPQGGFRAARATLFRDQTWILCTDFGLTPQLEAMEAFVTALGAKPLRMDADQHDAAVSLTSHVPQLLSSALATLAAEANAEEAAGPSFRGATRTAGGSIEMWRDIFASNADQVARVSRELGELLMCVAADLDRGEIDGAMRVLDSARSLRADVARAR